MDADRGMSSPEPDTRRLIHRRQISCEAYERDDGLWDLEASLSDTKTYPIPNRDRGTIEAGDPIHGMWLRVTVDHSFEIRDVAVRMEKTPFAICSAIEPDYARLVGVTIGPGWNRRLRDLFGGTRGCTHIAEMLGRLGTVAMQAMYGRRRSEKPVNNTRKPWVIDGCHAWAADGPVVEREFPDWYTGKGS